MRGSVVYPISANPPTWGHADIMARGARKFSRLYWAVGTNPGKSPLFSDQQRCRMLEAYVKHYKLDNVEIGTFQGATISYAKSKKADFLLRGLRSSQDFQMELELAWGNKGINEQIETVCIFCRPDLAPVSSSIVRELAILGENIERYVHPEIVPIIKEVLGPKSR